jgi:hypothetical protein
MPERIIVPITTCKYEKIANARKKGEVIKIENHFSDKRTKRKDKEFIKRNLGVEKQTFTEFIIEIGEADGNKLEQFCKYIDKVHFCLNCKKETSDDKVHMNSDYELVIPCEYCLSNIVDGSPQGKSYCKWWDSILQGYGLSFKDGMPPAVRAEWGTKCSECGGKHDGGGIEFSFAIE